MQDSIALLMSQNFEMHSALREAEVVLTKLQIAEAKATPPCEWFTPMEFALVQVRTALGMSQQNVNFVTMRKVSE